LYNILIFSIV